MTSTAVAGNPREWFNPFEIQRYRAEWYRRHSINFSFDRYLAHVRVASKSQNGVSGIKLHYYQFRLLLRRLLDSNTERNRVAFRAIADTFHHPQYIWLTRKDKARQAVSYYLAMSSGVWIVREGSTRSASRPRKEGEDADFSKIQRIENALNDNDGQWADFFQDNDVRPIVVHYEELAADYLAVTRRVLRSLNIANAETVGIPPPTLTRQANNESENLLGRFLEFKARADQQAAEPGSITVESPLLEISREPFGHLHTPWKRWVVESKIAAVPEEQIKKILIANGYAADCVNAELNRVRNSPYVNTAVDTARAILRDRTLLRELSSLAGLSDAHGKISRRSELSSSKFREQHYALNRPAAFHGLARDWPAVTKWTPTHLKKHFGEQIIEFMTGRDNEGVSREMRSHRTRSTFAEYIDKVYSVKVSNDFCIVAQNRLLDIRGMRQLLKDVGPLPEYMDQRTTAGQSYFWFGPAGTVIPLQRSSCNILAVQIAGRRQFWLVPAIQHDLLYAEDGRLSKVDCENPDFKNHPLFRHASALCVTLEPGDALFIPFAWWQCTRSLDVSIAISFTNFRFRNTFNRV